MLFMECRFVQVFCYMPQVFRAADLVSMGVFDDDRGMHRTRRNHLCHGGEGVNTWEFCGSCLTLRFKCFAIFGLVLFMCMLLFGLPHGFSFHLSLFQLFFSKGDRNAKMDFRLQTFSIARK